VRYFYCHRVHRVDPADPSGPKITRKGIIVLDQRAHRVRPRAHLCRHASEREPEMIVRFARDRGCEFSPSEILRRQSRDTDEGCSGCVEG